MENRKNYTKTELELLIADYVTGKLNSEDSRLFEQSICDYPEIDLEVRKYKDLFNRIDRNAYHERNDVLSRNVSAKLNERFKSVKNTTFIKNKVTFPAFSIIVIFVIYLLTNRSYDTVSENNTNINNNAFSRLLSNDFMEDTLITSNSMNDFSYSPAMQDANLEFDINTEMILDEVVNSQLSESVNIGHSDLSTISEDDLLSIFDNLDNNEVQIIIEELNNVKINP